ncbi:MAG: polyphosphate kinase 1 [Saprospiraceae bacterium]
MSHKAKLADVSVKYRNRELSWLDFNYRVLQEAKDPSVPLFERIKFMAIYSSNLDEFFRVRVANIRNLLRATISAKKEIDYDPKTLMKQILQTVNKQQEEFSVLFLNEILPALSKNNINLIRRLDMTPDQRIFVEKFFDNFLLPYVQPVLLIKNKIKPFLSNAALYLTVVMQDLDKSDPNTYYAIVKIPSDHVNRFIQLPSQSGRYDIIMLDDIVRHSIKMIFPGYDIIDTYSIKLTRDADLYIEDEFSGDLLQKIKSSLNKRNVGPASRLVYDREMPTKLLQMLKQVFDLETMDLLPEGRYHNNFDFFKFPSFGINQLKNNPQPPLKYLALENTNAFFDKIAQQDYLIQFPYQSYESVIRFFELAAEDPDVTHIKIIQYRVAKESRIMKALIKAVELGKQVTAFIEVKARFDEEANLVWGEKLEKAGINVKYSFPGLKVHAKIAMVIRQEDKMSKLYTYLSTGNFNEDTAKVYNDFGLFTSDERLTSEVSRIFSFLETVQVPNSEFEHLLVGQFNLRNDLVRLIKREIKHAKAGKEASIILKMNSLQDNRMIDLLYEASQAGVKIKMIIRGICCLVPGVEGLSENIEAISIVDRYLEHARVFVFSNNGEPDIYLSSADWMERNLSYRIETAFPIYDPEIRNKILNFLDLQFKDNIKARIIDQKHINAYKKGTGSIPVRCQVDTYFMLKREDEKQKQN